MIKKILRVLVIGAHPDDCEEGAGGTSVKFRRQGHVVKFFHATNGDAGHFQTSREELAARRENEVGASCNITGIEYEISNNHDAYLEADIATRDKFIIAIREFSPDIIITHRPNDYHPDHRNTSLLVQNSSYLVSVPIVCPSVKPLTKQPLILYMYDNFKKPIAFSPDIVVNIDDEMEAKVRMQACHVSQYYEWLPWINGVYDQVPEAESDKLAWLFALQAQHNGTISNQFRKQLIERFGLSKGGQIKYSEAFEVSEYGRSLSQEELNEFER